MALADMRQIPLVVGCSDHPAQDAASAAEQFAELDSGLPNYFHMKRYMVIWRGPAQQVML